MAELPPALFEKEGAKWIKTDRKWDEAKNGDIAHLVMDGGTPVAFWLIGQHCEGVEYWGATCCCDSPTCSKEQKVLNIRQFMSCGGALYERQVQFDV